MGGFQSRRADAIGADHGFHPGQGFGKPMRIAQPGVEESVLSHQRSGRGDRQPHTLDGRIRVERFQVGVQRPEQNVGIAGGLGQSEAAPVVGFVNQLKFKREFGGHKGGVGELKREAVNEPAQDEEQRFQGFDFVFQVHGCFEGLPGRARLDWPVRLPGGAFPEVDAGLAEPAPDLGLRQRRQCAERADAPAIENDGEVGRRLDHCQRQWREKGALVLHGEDG